jgi:dipeptide/tripeptide permease
MLIFFLLFFYSIEDLTGMNCTGTVCFFCSYIAFSPITKNLVSYLTESLHETNVATARNVSTWHGTSYLAPLLGAFLADSYFGQYWTVLIFCTIYIIVSARFNLSLLQVYMGVQSLLF